MAVDAHLRALDALTVHNCRPARRRSRMASLVRHSFDFWRKAGCPKRHSTNRTRSFDCDRTQFSFDAASVSSRVMGCLTNIDNNASIISDLSRRLPQRS
jgi:hypothetical protein